MNMKLLLTFFILVFAFASLPAQFKTVQPSGERHAIEQSSVKVPGHIRAAGNLSQDVQFSPQALNGVWVKIGEQRVFANGGHRSSTNQWWYIQRDQRVFAAGDFHEEEIVAELINELYPDFDFEVSSGQEEWDDTGVLHKRYSLSMGGYPVYRGDVSIHTRADEWVVLTPVFDWEMDLGSGGEPMEQGVAVEIVAEDMKQAGKWVEWNDSWTELGFFREKAKLVIYPDRASATGQVAWEISYHPNLREGWTYYVHGSTGEIMNQFLHTCSFHVEMEEQKMSDYEGEDAMGEVDVIGLPIGSGSVLGGPETAFAMDLYGQQRQINVWSEAGRGYYMIDGGRPMFNAQGSQMPDEPLGAIWTIDAMNTAPQSNNFTYDHFNSLNNTWNDRGSVSAHYNGGKAYEYFVNTFGRNSLNGQGGTMISLVNVADEDGGGLDNAFWNGVAIFYGNGRTGFRPLARSLDVAGHEMSHGVIQHTANLEYQGESGALNESYADIFGVMVDRDDWKLGEDVVRTSVFPSGALRDMEDPHNGGTSLNDNGWQPKHYNERYTGQEDNGGVHINSGIPNHAYYLIAEQIGKSKAEQIFYHALTKYLTKSSQFIDLRVAVDEAIKDLHGTNDPSRQVATNAFNAVGIPGNGGGGSGGNQNDAKVNPGEDLILFTTNNHQDLYVFTADGQEVFNPLTRTDPLSKPSITDDGSAVVFVGTDNHIHVVYIDWNQRRVAGEDILSVDPIWENVIVAKDGSLIAGLTTSRDNIIHVFGNNDYKPFELYNPTYTQGVNTGEVLYADAMEFDLRGEYIMYDAFNSIPQSGGGSIEYWDIGFLHAWNKQTNTPAEGDISKLFSALPQGISVGNPTFAKNSPYIVSFDLFEETNFGDEYSLLAANLELNELGLLFENAVLAYPSYSRSDDYVIFNARSNSGSASIAYVQLDESKINPADNPFIWGEDIAWGVWFSNGIRALETPVRNYYDESVLAIYPNPAQGEITVELDQKSDFHPGQINVYNVNGTQVLRTGSIKSTDNRHRIQLDQIPGGYYIIELVDENGNAVRRGFIKG